LAAFCPRAGSIPVCRRSTCPSSISSPNFSKARARSFDDDGVRAADQRFAPAQGLSRNIVPIIPDEARTFGLDALFKTSAFIRQRATL